MTHQNHLLKALSQLSLLLRASHVNAHQFCQRLRLRFPFHFRFKGTLRLSYREPAPEERDDAHHQHHGASVLHVGFPGRRFGRVDDAAQYKYQQRPRPDEPHFAVATNEGALFFFFVSSSGHCVGGGISLRVVGYVIYAVRATVREKSACLLEALFLIGFPL